MNLTALIPPIHLSVVAPELWLVAASLAVMLAALALPEDRKKQKPLSLIALAGLIGALVEVVLLYGAPQFAFGGAIVTDRFGSMMDAAILIAAGVGILTAYRELDVDADYLVLLLWAAVGMMVLTGAEDLMTMFLGLEILSLPLYILSGFRRDHGRSLEAGMKYLLLGAFSSGFFLYGLAFLYGASGTTYLKDLAVILNQGLGGQNMILFEIGLGLTIVGLGFKLALVPFHMWTPDVYEGAPTPITTFMSVGTKAAALAALARLLMVALPDIHLHWQVLLWVLAVLTMLWGNLAAISQTNVKRMLAYSGIGHAGYLLVALIAVNHLGVQTLSFYIVAYAFMNLGAFAVVAALSNSREEGAELSNFKSLFYQRPWIAIAMTIFLFSLASVPPTVGFPAKLMVIQSAVSVGATYLAIAVVVSTMFSLYYYLRPVAMMFTRPQDGEAMATVPKATPVLIVTVCALAVLTLGFGFFPGLITGVLHGPLMFGLQ